MTTLPSATTTTAPTNTAATRVSIQPLTTPFIPPDGCGNRFTSTHIVTSSDNTFNIDRNRYEKSTAIYEVALSIASLHPTCQPLGWNITSKPIFFSPAVCPSDWTAYQLRIITSVDITRTSTFSQAICCSSGFSYSDYCKREDEANCGIYCVKETSALSLTDKRNRTILPSESVGLFSITLHDAVQIAWQSSDITTLSPTPPTLTDCYDLVQISTWVPGSTVASGSRVPCIYRNSGSGHSLSDEPYIKFLMIGGPILLIFAICFCCWYWCWRPDWKKARREKKRIRREQRDRELLAAEAAKAAAETGHELDSNMKSNVDKKTDTNIETKIGQSPRQV